MILVTGASGFVGEAVVRRIVAGGHECRVLVRSGSGTFPHGVERVFTRDILDREALRIAVAGVHRIVHLAGRAHVIRDSAEDPYAAFQSVNVQGTITLAEMAAEAGVKRLVFLSSVAAFGSAPDNTLNDQSPSRPDTPYGISKVEAETALSEIANATGLEVVSLRAPAVLGPGMPGNPLRLFELVRRRLPLPFARLDGRRSFIFVDNLAQAIEAAMEMPICDYRPYLVSDGTAMSTAELVREMGAAIHVPVHLFGLPAWMLSMVGIMGDLLNGIIEVPVSSYEIRRLRQSFVIDGSRFAADAMFDPEMPLEQGMRHIGEWIMRH